MIKKATFKFEGKDVSIVKLSAHDALRAHAKVLQLIGPSLSDIISGVGTSESQQASKVADGVTKAFGTATASDEVASFIEHSIISGAVVFDGQKVQHLDDLDRHENIDGSELMYIIFTEWVKLNLGALLKKIGSHLDG